MSYDRQLERWTVQHRVGWLNPVFEGLSWIGGQGLVWLVIAAVLAVWWRRPWLLLQVALADFAAQLISYGLRQAIGRERPPQVYATPKPLVAVPHDGSFPSGHATASFACATTLAFFVPRAAPAFLLLAAAIAWSRVYVGVHYPLDVLGGAVLGVLIALALRFLARRWRWRAVGKSAPTTGPTSTAASAMRGAQGGGSAGRDARRPGA
jgi:undecaprenyl-diphosphatase